MARRLAKSLETLRSQVNEAWPNRSKISDSGIWPDAAHQARLSDHNPNSADVVTALDLTHNSPYFDAHALADKLLSNRHPNLKYLISNRRIAGAWSQWRWVGYAGSNPHDKHMHISVGVGDDGESGQPYDDTTKWNIIGGNMWNATPEQIKAIVRGFTHSYPGAGFNMNKFTGQPLTSGLLDELINSLVPYSEQKIKEYKDLQKQVSDLIAEGNCTPDERAALDSLYKIF